LAVGSTDRHYDLYVKNGWFKTDFKTAVSNRSTDRHYDLYVKNGWFKTDFKTAVSNRQ